MIIHPYHFFSAVSVRLIRRALTAIKLSPFRWPWFDGWTARWLERVASILLTDSLHRDSQSCIGLLLVVTVRFTAGSNWSVSWAAIHTFATR